jgi:hypothetical protein
MKHIHPSFISTTIDEGYKYNEYEYYLLSVCTEMKPHCAQFLYSLIKTSRMAVNTAH